MSSLSTGQQHMEEKILKRMEEMMAGLNQSPSGESSTSKQKGVKFHDSRTESGQFTPKLSKLEFPRYDGSEDPTN
jgi:hypothetical protein